MQHQSSELKHFTSTQELHSQKCSNKKYVKITEVVKETFLKYIIEQNMSIKKASQALRINYSSAKAILSFHKKGIRKNNTNVNISEDSSKRSNYRVILSSNRTKQSNFSINCSVGGKINELSSIELNNMPKTNNIPKTKTIFKPSILIPIKNISKKQNGELQIVQY